MSSDVLEEERPAKQLAGLLSVPDHLYSYGPYSDGVYSHGLFSYGHYSYGP